MRDKVGKSRAKSDAKQGGAKPNQRRGRRTWEIKQVEEVQNSRRSRRKEQHKLDPKPFKSDHRNLSEGKGSQER